MTPRRSDAREVLRALRVHRRLLAAACAAGAVAAGLAQVSPAEPATVTVLAAARDLRSGSRLAPEDVTELALPEYAVPAGSLRPGALVYGAMLSGAVRSGEPLTDARLLGPGLLAIDGPGDLRAVPVRIADTGTAALLRVGDRVDVLAARTFDEGGTSGPADVVAADVPVLAVREPLPGDGTQGALLVVGASPEVARALAGAATTSRLSVAIRPSR